MNAWALQFNEPLSYQAGVFIQERLLQLRVDDQIPDTVLFLQHNPVITLGARGRSHFLLRSKEALADLGIECVHSSRGGDVTFHGPGQLVLYPILKLGGVEADAHSYLYNLEEVAIRTAASFDVSAYRREGMNGAWTEQGKISAIGFRLKRWVTMHGMSFNVDVDLRGFESIVPCGLVGEPVSSLKVILRDRCPDLEFVMMRMREHVQLVFDRTLDVFDVDGTLPDTLEWVSDAIR